MTAASYAATLLSRKRVVYRHRTFDCNAGAVDGLTQGKVALMYITRPRENG